MEMIDDTRAEFGFPTVASDRGRERGARRLRRLPYEVEIAESWWGEGYRGELMFRDLFCRTAGANLDIIGIEPIICTKVVAPQSL
ncbi:hypothetical protein [Tsukamurella tyrosinosolvens]|uniref:hypothetical protein n=1 Tax=Tsukamurella tyrosinosolvens TaxID=57704 RepID=UPI0011C019F8|nr:hypothetical protein [Tsukamurella tyrosinosolvens]